uniref:non-specific serine/threonine protein kinase n=1 Tax=Leersia perrieri TaxID=77586 RepID=A0A0D9W2M0_9ORYZ
MAPLLFLFFLQFLLLLSSPSTQAQNISLGTSLTTQELNNAWLSPSGEFAFGFRPIEGNSSFYLLAVWFNKISDKTVTWYTKSSEQDPEPIKVPSGSSLQFTSTGVLSLRDPTNREVCNPGAAGAPDASMLDTGNFVIAAAGGSTVSWETFSYPTNTILVTQVLSPGKVLRSRLLTTDYSNGRFLLNIETQRAALYTIAVPSGNLYDSYWSTPSDENATNQVTDLVFNMAGRIYISMSNGTQINMTFGVTSSMENYYHRATLDPDGVFRQYVYPKKPGGISQAWTVVSTKPENICNAQTKVGSGTCGFNSYCMFDGNSNQTSCGCPDQYSFFDKERKYRGCKPDFELQGCELDEGAAMAQYEFNLINNVDWPQADYEWYTPIAMDECRRLCLIDCFCAVAVFHENTCWKKKLPLSNGIMSSGVQRTVLIKVPKSNNSQPELRETRKWKSDKKHWILGSSLLLGGSVVVNFVLISVLLFGTYCTITRKEVQQLQPSRDPGLPLKAFTYAELEKATDGFKEKIDKIQHETEKEFAVEVQTIGRTYHKNLVRMLGYCNEGTQRLLVYEFMINGSLNRFLFGDARPQWSLRAQLDLGVARGLLYLHEECSTQIIHCDIKPQNILLDDNCIAKISDFGLAKLLRTNQTQTYTGIRGTRGYVAPEWFKNIGITAKVDVYNFGVILLELICCRQNVLLEAPEEEQSILTYWANDCYRCGRVDLLIDGDDEANLKMKKVERFVAVALWCLQEDPTMRPSMLKVTQMLDGAIAIPTPPDSSSVIYSLS